MTPGQAVSARGRKIMQIMIKPEAADASTQISQADLEAALPPSVWSHPPGSGPAASAEEPQDSFEKRRARKKTKGIIGKAYSKEECQCENCASPEEDVLALEGIMPLVAPVPGQGPQEAPDKSPESSETSDDPLGWQPVGEVITTTTVVGRASSSEGSDNDASEGMQCENDGCRNRVGDWSYPECTSCWYEHN